MMILPLSMCFVRTICEICVKKCAESVDKAKMIEYDNSVING